MILTQWREEPITIAGIRKAVTVELLGYNDRIKYSTSGNKIVVIPPVINPSNKLDQYAWIYKIKILQ